MTDTQRQKLLDALLGTRDPRINDRMWAELAQIHREDILRLEPVIDKMLADAATEGRQRARKKSRELFQLFRGGSSFKVRG